MRSFLKTIIPSSLKYRLFVTFGLLILFPLAFLHMYYVQQIEEEVKEKASLLKHEQLEGMKQSFEDLLLMVSKTAILLEQDASIESVLKHPETLNVLERHHRIDTKFNSINNSYFLTSPNIYFTLLDFHGNVYTSYKTQRRTDYESMVRQPWFRQLVEQKKTFLWEPQDANDLHPEETKSPYLLSYYHPLKDRYNRIYGVVKLSMDYAAWLKQVSDSVAFGQAYFIVGENGTIMARADEGSTLQAESIKRLLSDDGTSRVFLNESQSSLINYSVIDGLNWYLVNKVPADSLFGEVYALRKKFLYTFFILTLLFIGATFVLSSTITNPLKRLQKEMETVVDKRLNHLLPEREYEGEFLLLTRHFNRMLMNIKQLVEKLKLEERQKEAVRMQMLVSQMNPHFLFNTLNTVKWIAMREKTSAIASICTALGKLLRSSLDNETELIHLKKEFDLLNSYVAIQKFRYKNQFRVHYDTDPSLQYALVPKLSLQPLVENAIDHGVSQLSHPGEIRITVFLGEDRLWLEVRDNGLGSLADESAASKKSGIGLKNLQERLDLLFKDEASLERTSTEQGTVVRMSLPYLPSPPYRKEDGWHVEGSVSGG